MEDVEIITKYIAAWSWQIIAVIFLSTTIIAAMMGEVPYIIGCAIGMGVAAFMALIRQRQLYNED